MARADVIAGVSQAAFVLNYNGGGTNHVVQKNGTTDTFYMVFVDAASDLVYTKTTDGGFTWSVPTVVRTGTLVAHAVWYDRWTGLSTDKIRIAYVDNNDIFYRDLDISSDTLGTETTVFDGTSSAAGGALSIVAGRDGRIAVAGSIDAGAEDGAWSSTDDGATWGDTIADPSEGATQDQYYLLPGWNADTADLMLIFVDASANGLSVKRYDDSANSWAETAIIADGSFVDAVPGGSFPHVGCFVDVTNSRNVIMGWSAVDTLNADLRAFVIVDTSVTETTANAVLNSTDDQGLVAACLDTGTATWYAIYTGKSDGSETFSTATKVYYKTTTDGGATWSAETALSNSVRSTAFLYGTPRFGTNFLAMFGNDMSTGDNILVSVNIPTGGSANLLAGKL